MATFVNLLQAIYGPNASMRESSAAEYKRMASECPDELVSSLLETMANHSDVQVRLKLHLLLNGPHLIQPVCRRSATA